MNRALKFVFLLVVVVAIVSPVLAKTGGIKVDDDAICEPDREDNLLADSCGAIIWLNLQQESPGTYTCQICDNGQCSACSGFTGSWGTTCSSDGYYYATFTTPSSEGSYTVVLSDTSGKNVSRDSFRVSFDEPCD